MGVARPCQCLGSWLFRFVVRVRVEPVVFMAHPRLQAPRGPLQQNGLRPRNALGDSSPTVVGKCLIGLGHLVQVLAALYRGTDAV